MAIILDHLTKSIREAAVFNPDVQIAPACILWPDRDRQWEPVIARLQAELPELCVLGDYAPDKLTGPAIWLRCVLAGTIEGVVLPEGHTPILYLPGISRQDLRAVESCPDPLKPLAELQYRGVIWSQINAKDWTLLAYLRSDQGGLALDAAQDRDAKNAMLLALDRLIDEDVELLKGKRLDKDYFNTLLTGGDPVRDLLLWLDDSEAFRKGRTDNEWTAFVEVCKSQLAFDPENEGELSGAAKLAERQGPWQAVWGRFCEAPVRYVCIPAQIRKCTSPAFDLFADEILAGGWPQWNEEQERSLFHDLKALDKVPAHNARQKIQELEKKHAARRGLVWSELGESPLAMALGHLSVMASVTGKSIAAGNVEDMEQAYRNGGWKADDALLKALSGLDKPEEQEAVTTAIRAIYHPWADEAARHLQSVVSEATYPGGTHSSNKPLSCAEGECVLFVDGLRYDTAKRLQDLLTDGRLEISEHAVWAALPSVTATGKPAISPVSDKIHGLDDNTDFEPSVAETGQSLKGGYHFKKLLKAEGFEILEHGDCGDGQGKAWCAFGDIDHEGHDRGWKLARHVDHIIGEVRDRVTSLLDTGWKAVHVVTDHGWLLLPGGLPKSDLSSSLTASKWGRCASLKPGATVEEGLYPWYWNPGLHFSLADGINCFKNGVEYTHGGLSLQECLTLRLSVSRGTPADSLFSAGLSEVSWRGLRCSVKVEGSVSGLSLDVRTQAGNAASSVAVSAKPVKEDGTCSVIIEDDDLDGRSVTVVLVDENGALVAQVDTRVGGE
ncbi:BREX-1 system phosphatase PglZ type B [Pontiellaceae bacterium B1224]|nr:BREX-1 system phosphatase PglZ type B [Pontiellaceae bacterium B1224]